jgi:hypothetical protein
MPGFTAEASLNENARSHRLRTIQLGGGRHWRVAQRSAASSAGTVVPAACCLMRCTHPESAPWAWECECTWECPE